MNTGSDSRGSSPAPRPRAERADETADVPAALYTLRAIVLGVAAVIGTVGVLAFVQVPNAVPGPAEAAAGLRPNDLVARPDCGAPCLGQAGSVRELDVLPVGPDVGALAVVTRVEPEPPMAATPPPASRPRPDAGSDETSDDDEKEKEKGKKRRGGDEKAEDLSGQSRGQGRDIDDEAQDDDD